MCHPLRSRICWRFLKDLDRPPLLLIELLSMSCFCLGFRDSGRISRMFIALEKKASSSWSFLRTLAHPQQICFYRLMLRFHFVISGYLHGAPKLKPEKLHLLAKKRNKSYWNVFFFFFSILMSLHYTWMDTSADDPSVFQILKVTSKYIIKSSKNILKNNICNYFQRKVKKRTQVGFNDPFLGYCLLDLLDFLVIMTEMFFIEETEKKVFLQFGNNWTRRLVRVVLEDTDEELKWFMRHYRWCDLSTRDWCCLFTSVAFMLHLGRTVTTPGYSFSQTFGKCSSHLIKNSN